MQTVTQIALSPQELKAMLLDAAEQGARKALTSLRPPDKEEILTVEDAAKLLRCSSRTIRERIKRGEIRATKRGRSFLIKKSEVKRQI